VFSVAVLGRSAKQNATFIIVLCFVLVFVAWELDLNVRIGLNAVNGSRSVLIACVTLTITASTVPDGSAVTPVAASGGKARNIPVARSFANPTAVG
jgi:hypothetical protein